MIMGYPRPKYFFSSLPNLLPQKIRLPLISFFSEVSYILGSQLHLGKLHLRKLHRERAVIGKIFQALPTQTDTTTIAFIYNKMVMMFGKLSSVKK
jgi:hypothetical protein